MREVFIYYRIQMNQIETARRDIQAFQARMGDVFPGLVARLLQRADDADGEHRTCMEHYRIDPAVSEAAVLEVTPEIQARIEQEATARLSRWITGPRHTEVFVPCAS